MMASTERPAPDRPRQRLGLALYLGWSALMATALIAGLILWSAPMTPEPRHHNGRVIHLAADRPALFAAPCAAPSHEDHGRARDFVEIDDYLALAARLDAAEQRLLARAAWSAFGWCLAGALAADRALQWLGMLW